jgi:hypothetical protein
MANLGRSLKAARKTLNLTALLMALRKSHISPISLREKPGSRSPPNSREPDSQYFAPTLIGEA